MDKSDVASIVICDAGPLIHLHELESLDLLADFAQVLIAETVWQETLHHQPSALANKKIPLIRLPDPPSRPPDQQLYDLFALDIGEQAALSLMRLHPEAIFLTDDAAARLAAQSLHYRVHGSIGILLRSLRRGQRTPTEILSLLETLPERSTLHITTKLLQEVIDAVRATYTK
jgi:predicted nucleic acid-binding protein